MGTIAAQLEAIYETVCPRNGLDVAIGARRPSVVHPPTDAERGGVDPGTIGTAQRDPRDARPRATGEGALPLRIVLSTAPVRDVICARFQRAEIQGID